MRPFVLESTHSLMAATRGPRHGPPRRISAPWSAGTPAGAARFHSVSRSNLQRRPGVPPPPRQGSKPGIQIVQLRAEGIFHLLQRAAARAVCGHAEGQQGGIRRGSSWRRALPRCAADRARNSPHPQRRSDPARSDPRPAPAFPTTRRHHSERPGPARHRSASFPPLPPSGGGTATGPEQQCCQQQGR